MRTTPASRKRNGLTLVEVLVVVAVLVLLVAILIPGIQSAREQARRAQCRGHLKMIALGMHNYHDNFAQFPPGYILNPNGRYLGWGWNCSLLPFYESSPLYSQLTNLSPPGLQAHPRSSLYSTPLPLLLCPSDGGSPLVRHVLISNVNVVDGKVTTGTLDVPQHFGRQAYFANAGYLQSAVGGIEPDATGDPGSIDVWTNRGSLGNTGTKFSTGLRYCEQRNFRGMFGQNSSVSIDDVKDGTSCVILAGERYTPRNEAAGAIGHGTWVGVPDCSTAAGLAMALGDTSVPLNAGLRNRAETTGFGSAHLGGANFTLADGSVVFLSNAINLRIYRDLSTIDDGRKLPSPF